MCTLRGDVCGAYHYVQGGQSSQHAVGGEQRGAVGVQDHRGALHGHVGRLDRAQWLKAHWELPGELWLRAVGLQDSRGRYGHRGEGQAERRVHLIGQEEAHVLRLGDQMGERGNKVRL